MNLKYLFILGCFVSSFAIQAGEGEDTFTPEDQGQFYIKTRNESPPIFRLRKKDKCWVTEDKKRFGGFKDISCKNKEHGYSLTPRDKIEEVLGVAAPPKELGSVSCIESEVYTICRLTRTGDKNIRYVFSMIIKGKRIRSDMEKVNNNYE